MTNKIVDFFPYYDPTGRQVTELRLRLFENIVDEFIIVETNVTHSGLPAQQGLENLIDEIGFPKEKIRIIKLDIPDASELDSMITQMDMLNCYGGNAANKESVLGRVRERLQKDAILSVFEEYPEDTLFIVSDQDEIINPDYMPWIVSTVNQYPQYILKIPMVQLAGRADLRVYDVLTNNPVPWNTSVSVLKKSHLRRVSPLGIRSCIQKVFETIYLTLDGNVVQDVGWHFTWMGGAKERVAKVEGFAHHDDKFDFLVTGSYSSPETKSVLSNMVLREGSMSPSCNKFEVLRDYPKMNLPKLIFKLPRVREYLLPNPPIPYDFDEAVKEIDMGGQPEVSARFVYDEFALENTYEKYCPVKDGDVIVDIGANIGLFPLTLKYRHPRRVYCVEPSNGLFEVLKKNTAKLPFPITYLHYGIGGSTGEKEITKDDWIYGEHGAPTFKTKTFKDFISENNIHHIHFFKIDCEGGEYDIFTEENYEFLTRNVDYITGEWHLGGIGNGVEKFIKFKNLYLKGKNNFRVFEPYQLKRDITKDVLDDAYVQKYFDWWDPRGNGAQFLIYIDQR
jgi:FkbM family methyltransferase